MQAEYEMNEEILRTMTEQCNLNPEYGLAINVAFENRTGARLTNNQVCALNLLSAFRRDNTKRFSDQQISVIVNFLADSLSNMQLNSELAKVRDLPRGLHQGVIDDIRALTYKTRHLETFNASLEKMHALDTKILHDDEVSREEKLSIRDIGILYELNSLLELVNRYFDNGLLGDNQDLLKLFKRLAVNNLLVNKLNTILNLTQMNTAGIAVIDMERYATSKGKVLSVSEKVDRVFSKHNHAVMLGKSPHDQSLQQTHLYADYKVEKLDALAFLYNDVYEINLSNLIPDDARALLQAHYGEEWLDRINALFQLLQNAVHENNVFSASNATVGRKSHLVAGASQVPVVGAILKSKAFSSHPDRKGLFPNIRREAAERNIKSAEEFRRELFPEHPADAQEHFYQASAYENKKILCSEHVAITLIGTLEELNVRLKKATGSDIRMVNIPISEREDLHKVTPTQLVKLLSSEKGYNCIRRVDMPAQLKEYVDETQAIPSPSKGK